MYIYGHGPTLSLKYNFHFHVVTCTPVRVYAQIRIFIRVRAGTCFVGVRVGQIGGGEEMKQKFRVRYRVVTSKQTAVGWNDDDGGGRAKRVKKNVFWK